MPSTQIPRADAADALPDLIPARMLNEYAYCPRLCYLEWVQGEFAESRDTLDGTFQHRRVDKPAGRLPPAGPRQRARRAEPDADEDEKEDGAEASIHSRSVPLSAPSEGLLAVIDLIEADQSGGSPGAPGGPAVTPVDYKRGRVPDTPEGCWEPERVQLCAQGLILRENGYRCDGGVIYYVESRTRVRVPFDEALVARTRDLVMRMRQMAAGGRIPPPLVDSPKCPRCSLVGICLPDETRLLADGTPVQVSVSAARGRRGGDERGGDDSDDGEGEADEPRVRLLIATRDDGKPLYVQEQRGYVGKKGDVVQVRSAEGGGPPQTLAEVRLAELTHVCLFGNVQISTQLVHELCDRQIPVAYFSWGGYFRGLTTGLPSKNVELRIRQYAGAADPAICLAVARALTAGKIENQRTMLRRNYGAGDVSAPPMALEDLRLAAEQARTAGSLGSLLGVEGNAARVYFGQFAGMLRPPGDVGTDVPRPEAGGPVNGFRFETRNRRPPTDPVNALLSLGYALLAKDLTVACWTVGLDPFLGFYHAPRYGRPALGLDLMEEFRALVVDSTVLTAVNTGLVGANDFVRRGPAVALKPDGRRRFIQAYERRMEQLVTHPVFGYRISYRRVLEVQARLLGRVLLGEVPAYVPFTTR